MKDLADLKDLPDALFVVDIKKESTAVKEARDKGITVAAIVDSNCNPDMVDYVIPANDDAAGSVKYIVGRVAEAIKEGREAWEKKLKKSSSGEKKEEDGQNKS